MKRKIKKAVCVAVAGVAAFVASFMTACSGRAAEDGHTVHIDCNWNGVCDTCGEPIDEASYVPEKPDPVKPDPEKPDPEKPDPVKPDPVKPDPVKPVAKITVKKTPVKNEYFPGDDFDPEGGVLTVNYTDRTTGEVLFTDGNVTFTNNDLSSVGSKTVTVNYGGKKATFVINVVKVGGTVTFDMNYTGDTDLTVKVGEGRAVSKPEDPHRDGFEFYDWYADKDCTIAYDFAAGKVIVEDTVIYAAWKGTGDLEVTYDLNYYGIAKKTYSQIVASGSAARPIAEPSREKYDFAGWYTDESLTQRYAAGSAIDKDTVLRAKWDRTASGVSDYTFEAEHTDLSGKIGPGFSGELVGANMIITDVVGSKNFVNASGGKYVSSLYKNGLGLEFYIACSEKVTDAEISVYLTLDPSLNVNSLSFTSDTYQLKVNGQPQSFSDFTVTRGDFSEKIKISGVTLNEGANMIQLLTNNSDHPLGVAGGGTYQGSAPIVDRIVITTSAVLAWDENYGLPANKN